MGNVYFFTGYPGFIAQSLLKEIDQADYNADHIYLLTLPAFKSQATALIEDLTAHSAGLNRSDITILEGDITKENLGLQETELSILKNSVTHVFHLAAVYDLQVPRDVAQQVNVVGTANVTDWAETLDNLVRYIYFSTAYVSGNREGTIYEAELEMNQSFRNHYEKSKYEAEVYVRNRKSKLPLTVIRPGIVRGHSVTGETTKFDGPYFMLRMFDQLEKSPVIPYIGQGKAEGNFVPVDYVIKGSVYLGHLPSAEGKTYHLTDPAPYRMFEVYRMLLEEYQGKTPKGRIPFTVAEKSLIFAPMRKFLNVQREGMHYFTVLSSYDCRQANKDLAESGITCPSFDRTLETMVRYYRDHKNDKAKQVQVR